MKPFFRKAPKKSSTFSIGSRCTVRVPKAARDTHGPFDEASVQIVSKKDYLARYPISSVEKNKVVCKILSAPNAPKGVRVAGLEYPIRRSWLIEDGHKCV